MTPQKYFPDIAAVSWEHRSDREAFAAFSAIPRAHDIVERFLGLANDRAFRLVALANGLRVSENQFTGLHHLVRKVCDILDARFEPEVYVEFSPHTRSYSVGFETPFVVVTSSALDLFDDQETLALLAREIAHCMSGRVPYKTLLWFLENTSPRFLEGYPCVDRDAAEAMTALKEWNRRSELSADRAALLVTQDETVVLRMLMKQIAGPRHADCNVHELVRQADERESIRDGAALLPTLDGLHQDGRVMRVAELRRWERSAEYRSILNGDYRRRSAGTAANPVADGPVRELMAAIHDGTARVDAFFKTVLGGR